MSLQTIQLTPEQTQELAGPLSLHEAKCAMMTGFIEAISKVGMLPSEAEDVFRKIATNDKFGEWVNIMAQHAIWEPMVAASIKATDDENLKTAGWSDIAEMFGKTVANGGVWLPLGLGAIGGGFTAYQRDKWDRALDDKNSPEVLALKEKIKTYKTMTTDLKRTNRLGGISNEEEQKPDAVPVPA